MRAAYQRHHAYSNATDEQLPISSEPSAFCPPLALPIPGIERSPIDMWREAAVDFVPRFLPADALGDLFRSDRFRMIGPRGVSWGGRTYWSEAVPSLVKRWGETRPYEVRGDPTDITGIEIRTPERKWVRLNARWV